MKRFRSLLCVDNRFFSQLLPKTDSGYLKVTLEICSYRNTLSIEGLTLPGFSYLPSFQIHGQRLARSTQTEESIADALRGTENRWEQGIVIISE